MSRLGNALALLRYLNTSHRIGFYLSSEVIMNDLGWTGRISTRQFRRYINDIRESGIYISRKRGMDGGYCLTSKIEL